jgi:hypothetical protein
MQHTQTDGRCEKDFSHRFIQFDYRFVSFDKRHNDGGDLNSVISLVRLSTRGHRHHRRHLNNKIRTCEKDLGSFDLRSFGMQSA